MTIHYNVTGSERKRLVDCISGSMGIEKKYLGAPSFAYQIGCLTVIKDGAISFEDLACSSNVEALMADLEGQGFHTEDAIAKADTLAPTQPHGYGLTIMLPISSFTPEAQDNLNRLLTAKGPLIRKALSIETLPVKVSDDTVSFPWFEGKNLDANEVKAYTHLITALCDMARNQKRITAKERETDNDKYAFRCFLLRLGFIGAEFKDERKILLSKLSGNSAFKSGTKEEVALVCD